MTTFTNQTKHSTTTASVSKSLVIVDSYSEIKTTTDSTNIHSANITRIGETFSNVNASILDSCKFYLSKLGSPTGTATAKLYAITGSYGVNATPTGSALATSDTFDISTLTSGRQLITFNFTNANRVTLSAATHYAILLDANSVTGDGVNFVQMGDDGTTASQSGELVWTTDNVNYSRLAGTSFATAFYVYGSPALTFVNKS